MYPDKLRGPEMGKTQAQGPGMAGGYDEPRAIILGALSRQLESEGDRLAQAVSTVALFLERAFGPQPESGTTGAPTPQPVGMFQEIERHLSRNDYLLGELGQKLRRLDDIA